MNIHKRITYIVSIALIGLSSLYTSLILGSLAHELIHKQTAKEAHAIIINYDFTGEINASSYDAIPHKWVYFQDDLVGIMLFLTLCLCLMNIIFNKNYEAIT